jgi:hypothetical protein
MKSFVAICCCLSSFCAVAQTKQAPSELELLQSFKYSAAYSEYWSSYVHQIAQARDLFASAAEKMNCTAIPQDAPLLLNPAYRSAIENVMGAYRKAFSADDPALRRWVAAVPLYAYGRLSPTEQASLVAFYRDPALMKEVAALDVLRDIPATFRDDRTGAMEAAGPIWLKTYFRREGKLPALRKAIAAVPKAPLIKAFDRVGGIEAHSEADEKWLSLLASDLVNAAEPIAKAYEARIPGRTAKRIKAFESHPFHAWLAKAHKANGDPVIDAFFPLPHAAEELSDSEIAGIRAELREEYPPPRASIQRMAEVDAMDLGAKQAERFCPPQTKKD